MTNNKDLNYIAECAESVGIHVDEHTAISIPFIADVMRKMREQSNSDEDCISREQALSDYAGFGYGYANNTFYKHLKSMPSVQPKPKTGHWTRGYKVISHTDYKEHIPQCKCSECGYVEDSYISQFSKYCPNCGAKMIEPQNLKYADADTMMPAT